MRKITLWTTEGIWLFKSAVLYRIVFDRSYFQKLMNGGGEGGRGEDVKLYLTMFQ